MKLVLASRSPRRQMLLRQAGYDPRISPSPIDEKVLKQGQVGPAHWVIALAYIKAWSTMDQMPSQDDVIVLGADTVCVVDGMCIGQPHNRAEAFGMIHHLQGRSHRTITGVCLLGVAQRGRHLLFDSAHVSIGRLDDDVIDSYVQSDAWRGKAGGYNLAERLKDGWPIEVDGDPTTVMGLPMMLLEPWLDRFGVTS